MTSKQCKATKSNGERCKNTMADGARGLCFYHYGWVCVWLKRDD